MYNMPKMMRKRSFDRTVVKTCPNCETQSPVACKTCTSCGQQFTKKAPNGSKCDPCANSVEEDAPAKIRRTERTRRERPDFFNAMVFDSQSKKSRKKSIGEGQDTPPKKKRGRPKGVPNKTVNVNLEEADKDRVIAQAIADEDMYARLTPEKTLQLSIILSELNRKFTAQNFKPS